MGHARSSARTTRADTADAILEAARRRYARFGPRKTTMGEVAREAGCSRATLYLHFPSKEALYSGLIECETRDFLLELEAQVVRTDLDARRKLQEIVATTARIYASNPVLRAALSGDEEMSLDRVAVPAVRSYEKRVLELLQRVLEDGVEEGVFREIDAASVAYLMYELGRVLVTREVAGRGDFPFERILSVMDDFVARGIENPDRDGARKEKRKQ